MPEEVGALQTENGQTLLVIGSSDRKRVLDVELFDEELGLEYVDLETQSLANCKYVQRIIAVTHGHQDGKNLLIYPPLLASQTSKVSNPQSDKFEPEPINLFVQRVSEKYRNAKTMHLIACHSGTNVEAFTKEEMQFPPEQLVVIHAGADAVFHLDQIPQIIQGNSGFPSPTDLSVIFGSYHHTFSAPNFRQLELILKARSPFEALKKHFQGEYEKFLKTSECLPETMRSQMLEEMGKIYGDIAIGSKQISAEKQKEVLGNYLGQCFFSNLTENQMMVLARNPLTNLNYVTADGQSILPCLVEKRGWNILRELLKTKKVHVINQARGGDGMTPLTHIITFPNLPAYLLQEMLDAGADVNQQIMGVSPLARAIARGLNPTAVNVLIQAGAKVDASSKLVYTELVSAIESDQVAKLETIEALLKAGADPNVPDPFNQLTPLGYAVRAGDENIIFKLIEFGAEPSYKTQGMNVVSYFLENGPLKSKKAEMTQRIKQARKDFLATQGDKKPAGEKIQKSQPMECDFRPPVECAFGSVVPALSGPNVETPSISSDQTLLTNSFSELTTETQTCFMLVIISALIKKFITHETMIELRESPEQSFNRKMAQALEIMEESDQKFQDLLNPVVEEEMQSLLPEAMTKQQKEAFKKELKKTMELRAKGQWSAKVKAQKKDVGHEGNLPAI